MSKITIDATQLTSHTRIPTTMEAMKIGDIVYGPITHLVPDYLRLIQRLSDCLWYDWTNAQFYQNPSSYGIFAPGARYVDVTLIIKEEGAK